jgi:hypothetical protein
MIIIWYDVLNAIIHTLLFILADNLSWKISAVLKGQVADSEGLLNSYETEVK